MNKTFPQNLRSLKLLKKTLSEGFDDLLVHVCHLEPDSLQRDLILLELEAVVVVPVNLLVQLLLKILVVLVGSLQLCSNIFELLVL
jgi:hypothetical protein